GARMACGEHGAVTLGDSSIAEEMISRCAMPAPARLASAGASTTDPESAQLSSRGLLRWWSRGKAPSSAPQGLHALVGLQRADGSWELTPEFARILGRTLGNL